jgi:hypothetical protein
MRLYLMANYDDQMDMFEDGGLMEEGGTVDPVSGNDVPTGSTQEEVRDDIDAKLSEGEFVLPADVVRYIGLENIMKMRDMAKEGLAKMEAMGQMGNSEEATMDDESDFDSAIDEFIESLDKEEYEVEEFAVGGLAGQPQGPLTPEDQAAQIYQQTSGIGFLPPGVTAPGVNVDLPKAPVITPGGTGAGGTPTYETKQYIGPNGEIRSFTFINGQAFPPIPEGFTEYDPAKVPEATTGVPTAKVTDSGGGDGPEQTTPNVDPVVGTARAISALNPNSTVAKATEKYDSRMTKIGIGAAVSALSGSLPGLALAAYRGYKANKEFQEEVGPSIAKNNPTLGAVLAETGRITSMTESDVSDSITAGVEMGMSPGLAAAITASGGKIGTSPAVTEVDINTGLETTRQGQTSIEGLTGNAESAVRSMYGDSLSKSNPTAYRDMVEEAAFYDATGLGVMSTAPTGGISRQAEALGAGVSTQATPTTPTTPTGFDPFTQAMFDAEAGARLGAPDTYTDEFGNTITESGAPVRSRGFTYDIDTLTAGRPTTQFTTTTAPTAGPSPTETAKSIAATEAEARSVSSGESDLGGSSFGSQGEADAVANDGWGSDAHFDAIDAQFDANTSSSDSGSDSGGSYCCTKMVEHELWSTRREYAKMCVWHRKQPQWWIDGYDIWGKVIANTVLAKKSPFWTRVMQEFYEHHALKKERTIYSTIGDITIYPGSFICGMIAKTTGRHINAV